jgi:hypothetical protein
MIGSIPVTLESTNERIRLYHAEAITNMFAKIKLVFKDLIRIRKRHAAFQGVCGK